MARRRRGRKITPEDLLWRKRGWICQIIENENDDGWAVSMTREGDTEPVLIGPWTMGRNKKDPKPMNELDFTTLVKTASEYLQRSQFQSNTQNRQILNVTSEAGDRVQVVFDVVRDDFEPYGELIALDPIGEELARCQTSARFRLTLESAEDWVNSGFEPPAAPAEVEYQEMEYEEDGAVEYEESVVEYEENVIEYDEF